MNRDIKSEKTKQGMSSGQFASKAVTWTLLQNVPLITSRALETSGPFIRLALLVSEAVGFFSPIAVSRAIGIGFA